MATTYTSRPMWLTKETAYTVERDGLRVQEKGGGAKVVPWREIGAVRVHWVKQKNQPRVHFTQITLKGARFPTVHFSQLRFQGMLSFVDQSAGYNAFLRTLAARIADEAPHAKFWTGSGPIERLVLCGLVWAIAAVALLIGCAGLLRLMDLDGLNLPLLLIAVGAGLGWLGWKIWGWTAPKPVDPRNLPHDILAPVAR